MDAFAPIILVCDRVNQTHTIPYAGQTGCFIEYLGVAWCRRNRDQREKHHGAYSERKHLIRPWVTSSISSISFVFFAFSKAVTAFH